MNPEYIWFSIDVQGSTSNDTVKGATIVFPTPPGTSFGNQDTVTIVELLSISQQIANFPQLADQFDMSATLGSYALARLSVGGQDAPEVAALISTPSQRTFWQWWIQAGNAQSAIASHISDGGPGGDSVRGIDLTDKNGHGILLYGNTVSFTSMSFARAWPSSTTRFMYCMKYRLKNVSLKDYIAGSAAIGGVISGSVQSSA